MKDKAHKDPARIKFKCLVNNDFEEVVAYNDLVNFIEKDTSWEGGGLSKRSCPTRSSRRATRITMEQVQIVLFFGVQENKRGSHCVTEVAN